MDLKPFRKPCLYAQLAGHALSRLLVSTSFIAIKSNSGNAMSMPVVGSILASFLATLDYGPGMEHFKLPRHLRRPPVCKALPQELRQRKRASALQGSALENDDDDDHAALIWSEDDGQDPPNCAKQTSNNSMRGQPNKPKRAGDGREGQQ